MSWESGSGIGGEKKGMDRHGQALFGFVDLVVDLACVL
jgi:hypothetical protein